MSDASGPAVVAFGDDAPTTDPRRHAVGRWALAITADRRLVPVIAGLAGVAAFGSLLGRWYTFTLPNADATPTGDARDVSLHYGANDSGSFGTAYLLGIFALAVATVFVLAGPPAVRRASRLAGLTLAGGVLAMLVSVSVTYDDQAGDRFFYGGEEQFVFTTGSGLTSAYLAVGLVGLALFLAGRSVALARPPAAAVATEALAAPEADWAWRPPRPARDETAAEVAAAAPLDLTVQPARPFARPDNDDRRR